MGGASIISAIIIQPRRHLGYFRRDVKCCLYCFLLPTKWTFSQETVCADTVTTRLYTSFAVVHDNESILIYFCTLLFGVLFFESWHRGVVDYNPAAPYAPEAAANKRDNKTSKVRTTARQSIILPRLKICVNTCHSVTQYDEGRPYLHMNAQGYQHRRRFFSFPTYFWSFEFFMDKITKQQYCFAFCK